MAYENNHKGEILVEVKNLVKYFRYVPVCSSAW
jgi:hypothetical protein